jgi:hypothetical protein
MAISVDTIYQRVLALANKEQRGYITPQEFNLLANQAQMSIFESYFYAKNQRDKAEPNRTNEVDESDIVELLDRKLAPFQSFEATDGRYNLSKRRLLTGLMLCIKQVWCCLEMNHAKRSACSRHSVSRLRLGTC